MDTKTRTIDIIRDLDSRKNDGLKQFYIEYYDNKLEKEFYRLLLKHVGSVKLSGSVM